PSSTWSRCTPATCGARSTCRSAGPRCRRCAAPATDWPPMAGEHVPPDQARPADSALPADQARPDQARPADSALPAEHVPPDQARPDQARPADSALPGKQARPWRRLGLRARLTLVASAGIAVALTAAALLLLGELQSSLTREADGNARQAATEVARLAGAHELPKLLPFGPGTLSVQVLGRQGRVSNATAQGDRLVPLLRPALARAVARSGRVVQMAGGPF